ncbi:adenosylcobinamide-GDP ribazoletransferase [Paenibacillus caui]|uniref:adenosylcobinamide-GDP ribazoletransferase n=1 Tax=Paenibacillus caui TaxID=2873927 RepID=UPI001CA914AF|nr:adenosylcobinamide-GDP ribazoletransferase [Paenibacillus caui]
MSVNRRAPLLAAFQFLSRFPVKTELDFTPELLQKSTKHYPLVGAAIGTLVLGFSLLWQWALPAMPAAALTLIVWVWMTGGLHLDGWMDSADALLSYRSRARMLEIMKDSRVGAMGVLCCVLLLLLKFTLIESLLEQEQSPLAAAALITVPIWSRWFIAYAMTRWPAAKGREGLAGLFSGLEGGTSGFAFGSALVLSAVPLVTSAAYMGAAALNDWAPAIVLLVVQPIVSWGAGSWGARTMVRKLGGLTGDTYGALNEGVEAILLLTVLLLLH